MTIETENLLEEYAEIFGEGFPTIPLIWGRTEDEFADLVKKCIKKKKDAYKLGLVKPGQIY